MCACEMQAHDLSGKEKVVEKEEDYSMKRNGNSLQQKSKHDPDE